MASDGHGIAWTAWRGGAAAATVECVEKNTSLQRTVTMMRAATANDNRLIMEIESDPDVCAEVTARFDRCQQNVRWLMEHAAEAYSHRGKYICVAGRQLFVADSPEHAIRAAETAHPDDDGRFTLYVPVDKVPRIYAC